MQITRLNFEQMQILKDLHQTYLLSYNFSPSFWDWCVRNSVDPVPRSKVEQMIREEEEKLHPQIFARMQMARVVDSQVEDPAEWSYRFIGRNKKDTRQLRTQRTGIYVLGTLATQYREMAKDAYRSFRQELLHRKSLSQDELDVTFTPVEPTRWPPGEERAFVFPMIEIPYDRGAFRVFGHDTKARWAKDPAICSCECVILGFFGKAVATCTLNPWIPFEDDET